MGYDDVFGKNKIYFSEILRLDWPTPDYELIKDMKILSKKLEEKLDEYNNKPENQTKLDLVFFDYAI